MVESHQGVNVTRAAGRETDNSFSWYWTQHMDGNVVALDGIIYQQLWTGLEHHNRHRNCDIFQD